MKESLALAKTKPGMGYATSGAGTGQHMAGEWLARLSGIQLTHVAYKGGIPILLDQWLGFLVPAGTPADIIRRLNAATDKALALPAVRERLAPQGLEVAGGSAEQFARIYREDFEKYGKLVKELSIKINGSRVVP